MDLKFTHHGGAEDTEFLIKLLCDLGVSAVN
jgi:hypothetical protein